MRHFTCVRDQIFFQNLPQCGYRDTLLAELNVSMKKTDVINVTGHIASLHSRDLLTSNYVIRL